MDFCRKRPGEGSCNRQLKLAQGTMPSLDFVVISGDQTARLLVDHPWLADRPRSNLAMAMLDQELDALVKASIQEVVSGVQEVSLLDAPRE